MRGATPSMNGSIHRCSRASTTRREGAIIVVMPRLHEDDLIGHVITKGGWELLAFPAIAEEAASYDGRRRPMARGLSRVQPAMCFMPGRESRAADAAQGADGAGCVSGPISAGAMPARRRDGEGEMVSALCAGGVPRDFEARMISCDTADKASELSDYTVFTVWGVKDRHLWLLAVLRRRMEYYELKRVLKETVALHRADVVLIEDRASGTQLIQEFEVGESEGHQSLPTRRRQTDAPMGPSCDDGTGLRPSAEEAPWLDDYLRELTSFPNARHDDQVGFDHASHRLGRPTRLPGAGNHGLPRGRAGHVSVRDHPSTGSG